MSHAPSCKSASHTRWKAELAELAKMRKDDEPLTADEEKLYDLMEEITKDFATMDGNFASLEEETKRRISKAKSEKELLCAEMDDMDSYAKIYDEMMDSIIAKMDRLFEIF